MPLHRLRARFIKLNSICRSEYPNTLSAYGFPGVCGFTVLTSLQSTGGLVSAPILGTTLPSGPNEQYGVPRLHHSFHTSVVMPVSVFVATYRHNGVTALVPCPHKVAELGCSVRLVEKRIRSVHGVPIRDRIVYRVRAVISRPHRRMVPATATDRLLRAVQAGDDQDIDGTRVHRSTMVRAVIYGPAGRAVLPGRMMGESALREA